MTKLFRFLCVAPLLLPVAPAAADVRLLTQACEEALALSALPKRLRSDASAYVLTQDGYMLSRRGSGPFTCIVERNHENALIPQCPDAAGADSIIPGIMKKTEWALQGLSADERRERLDDLVRKGDLKVPSRPGISYMMSNFSYTWNARNEALSQIPPHVMFYAPNISNDDIGGSMQEGFGANRGYPFIVEEGAHGYITTLVEKASDENDVLAVCEGQIPDVSTTVGNVAARDSAEQS